MGTCCSVRDVNVEPDSAELRELRELAEAAEYERGCAVVTNICDNDDLHSCMVKIEKTNGELVTWLDVAFEALGGPDGKAEENYAEEQITEAMQQYGISDLIQWGDDAKNFLALKLDDDLGTDLSKIMKIPGLPELMSRFLPGGKLREFLEKKGVKIRQPYAIQEDTPESRLVEKYGADHVFYQDRGRVNAAQAVEENPNDNDWSHTTSATWTRTQSSTPEPSYTESSRPPSNSELINEIDMNDLRRRLIADHPLHHEVQNSNTNLSYFGLAGLLMIVFGMVLYKAIRMVKTYSRKDVTIPMHD